MRERLSDVITTDDLADSAFMSRFHFNRIFSQVTGVSPGRFLTAIRIQEAKRLLLSTTRSVTEISLDVGYSSLGTFTRIFTDFVGFSPKVFRQLSMPLLGFAISDITTLLASSQCLLEPPAIQGTVLSKERFALITVALFREPIPRSRPIECVCLTKSSRFSFRNRVGNKERIFGAGLLPTATIQDAILGATECIQVGVIQLSSTTDCHAIALQLRPMSELEPPIVVAYPLLIARSLVAPK
jgi:AraC-like DNA-binding protein